MSCDPVIVVASTQSRATEWAKRHISAACRRPLVCDETLRYLIGTRDRCIVILPCAKIAPDRLYVLSKNTVIRVGE